MSLIYLCESSYFVSMHFLFFCQKCRFFSILLHSILFFVLFYEPFIESIYQLSMYQNFVGICAACTALKLEYETYEDCYFFTFFYFPSEVIHLTFPPHILFCLCKVWNMLHHGSVGRVQNKIKNTLIYFQVLFRQFLLFFIIKLLFLSWCTI